MLLIGSQEYVVVLLHSFFGPLIVLKRTLGGTANGALKSLRLSGITWPHTLNLRSVSPTKAKKRNIARDILPNIIFLFLVLTM